MATSQPCGDFEVFTGAYTPTANYALSLAADGKAVAFSKCWEDGDFLFEVWDIERSVRLCTYPFATPVVTTTFSADGAMLAASCVDGTLTVWSMDSGNVIWQQSTMSAGARVFARWHKAGLGRGSVDQTLDDPWR